MKNNQKALIAALMLTAFIVVSLLTPITYAGEGRDEDWAPYTWSNSWIWYSSGNYGKFKSDSIEFDSTAYNWWQFERHDTLMYTHDVTEVGTKFSAKNWYATNFPGPVFDSDDDNCDGKYEEAEITAAAAHGASYLHPSNTYYCHFKFTTPGGTGSSKLQLSAQVSWFGLAYEGCVWEWGWHTVPGYSDVLETKTCYYGYIPAPVSSHLDACTSPPPVSTSFYSHKQVPFSVSQFNPQCNFMVVEEAPGVFEVTIRPLLRSTSEFLRYRKVISERVDDLLQSDMTEAQIVLTFNKLVSVNEFISFVDEYQITVDSFETRVTTSDGDIWTIGGAPSESELFPLEEYHEMLTDVKETIKDEGADFAGVYALVGRVQCAEINALFNDKLVLLCDLSPALILQEAQEQGFDQTLEFVLNDIYWDAEYLGLIS